MLGLAVYDSSSESSDEDDSKQLSSSSNDSLEQINEETGDKNNSNPGLVPGFDYILEDLYKVHTMPFP